MKARYISVTVLTVILIVSLPVFAYGNVYNTCYGRAMPISAETPQLVLQQGTAGTSTVYTNGTSAKVSAVAPRNWWNSSWLYRKQMNITENSGNELTNYAINFTINTQELIANNKMNDDCGDIRFIGSSYIYEMPVTINNSQNPNELINYQAKINITDQSVLNRIAADGKDIRLFSSQQSNPYTVENEIPLWIHSKTANELILWTNVNVSSFATKTLYMYYGNQSATTVSNGTAVFEFYDDFSTDTKSAYTIVDLGVNSAPSSWSVAGGRMQETTNIYTHGAPHMNGTYAYRTSGDWGNYIYEAKVMTTDDDFIGLVFRYANNSNYYRFAWMRQDHTGSGSVGPGRYLHEIVGGAWNTIDSDIVAYTIGQWYDFRIVMNGSYIEAYIDDSLVLNGTSSGSTSGKVGMYDWACEVAYWDDLRIRKLVSPEPTISIGMENQIESEDIELSYWIESGLNTPNTRIWVKIPSISSYSNVTIYMYYGNSGASSGSDGKSTFYRYLNFSSSVDGIDGGVSGQDGQGGLPTNYEVLNGGRTLHIWGNVWKYTILSTTVNGDGSQILEVNMSSTDNGELQGVGISNIISGPDPSYTYKFTGSQSWGLTPDVTYSGAGGDWQKVHAILGDFSGTYSYFIWMGDDDADGSQNCSFKDVRVRPYVSPEPSVSIGVEETISYDYVLKIVNQLTNNWAISLQTFDGANISRLSSATIGFHDGNSSDQIIVNNGVITQTEGTEHNLEENATVYISISNLQAITSETSLLHVYLKIRLADTTVYNLMVITFEFS
jgi:hypothetical protein